jgi:predicted transcriptional regulator
LEDVDNKRRNFLNVDPELNFSVIRGMSSPVRIQILKLLRQKGAMNVNQISDAVALPQSTVATHIQILQESGLIDTQTLKASKGQQKICTARYDEVVIRLAEEHKQPFENIVEVAMPLGLYTGCGVSAPCGMCSTQRVIGILDVPDLFLDPGRMQAALLWFGRGYVEYKFPNNAKLLNTEIEAIEFSLELSSETPGTNSNWPSDISLWVNDIKIGTWTSPGDYGDKRGTYTPHWWKLKGSQYGELTSWKISDMNTTVNQTKVSDVGLSQLALDQHHSIRLKIGIDDEAKNPGGINIFGKGFGNQNQDIVMRLHLKDALAS